MSCNKALIAFICVATVPHAVATQKMACPASVWNSDGKHILYNASVYDGPPDQMASLEPVQEGNVDRWDVAGSDPYLLCQYKGTERTVTLHAKGVTTCMAGRNPFQAYCK